MSVSESDIEFAMELFAPLGELTNRKMMGGLTIYHAGQVFAIVSGNGEIFLKAKGDFAGRMSDAGARQFGSDGKTMGYWTIPEAALDDPDIACDWARQALANI